MCLSKDDKSTMNGQEYLKTLILSHLHLVAKNNQGTVFTTFHFLRKLTNRPNKLECYITLGLKGLPISNTQTYWSNS